MTAITYDGNVPTVAADEDTWGAELNTGLTQVKADLDMLNTAPANTILGRNEGTSGEVERLTAAEAAAMLPAVVGDTGTGGTKGLVPAPGAGDAAAEKYLNADGTWGIPRPFAFAKINGSTGAIVAGVNVASTVKATGTFDVVFTTAASSASYTILATAELTSATGFGLASVDAATAPTTAGFRIKTAALTNVPAITLADPAFLYVTVWQ